MPVVVGAGNICGDDQKVAGGLFTGSLKPLLNIFVAAIFS